MTARAIAFAIIVLVALCGYKALTHWNAPPQLLIDPTNAQQQWVTPETMQPPRHLVSPCPLTIRNLPRFPEYDT